MAFNAEKYITLSDLTSYKREKIHNLIGAKRLKFLNIDQIYEEIKYAYSDYSGSYTRSTKQILSRKTIFAYIIQNECDDNLLFIKQFFKNYKDDIQFNKVISIKDEKYNGWNSTNIKQVFYLNYMIKLKKWNMIRILLDFELDQLHLYMGLLELLQHLGKSHHKSCIKKIIKQILNHPNVNLNKESITLLDKETGHITKFIQQNNNKDLFSLAIEHNQFSIIQHKTFNYLNHINDIDLIVGKFMNHKMVNEKIDEAIIENNNQNGHNGQSNNGQSDNGKNDNGKNDNGQSNNGQSNNGQSNNGQSDKNMRILMEKMISTMIDQIENKNLINKTLLAIISNCDKIDHNSDTFYLNIFRKLIYKKTFCVNGEDFSFSTRYSTSTFYTIISNIIKFSNLSSIFIKTIMELIFSHSEFNCNLKNHFDTISDLKHLWFLKNTNFLKIKNLDLVKNDLIRKIFQYGDLPLIKKILKCNLLSDMMYKKYNYDIYSYGLVFVYENFKDETIPQQIKVLDQLATLNNMHFLAQIKTIPIELMKNIKTYLIKSSKNNVFYKK